MNMSQRESTEAQFSGTCITPDVQDQVFEYIADLLEDREAERIEDHLLDCRHCREFFLTMRRIGSEAHKEQNSRGGEDGQSPNSHAQVLRLSDFRSK